MKGKIGAILYLNYIVDSKVYFVNNSVIFTPQLDSSLFHLSKSWKIVFMNNTIMNTHQTIFRSEQSRLYIFETNFINIKCAGETYKGCLFLSNNGSIYFQNSTLSICESIMEKYLFYVSNSIFLLNNLVFKELKASPYLFYIEKCNITLNKIIVQKYNKGLFRVINSRLIVVSSIFLQNISDAFVMNSNSDLFSTISCEECQTLFIYDSVFKANENKIKGPGVIYIELQNILVNYFLFF